jgi:[ribosomal protein S5]-alanine N-acetyltransferase
MRIDLADGYFLSGIEQRDEDAHVRHLADGEIGTWIPVIPRPYTREAAKEWIRHRVAFAAAARVEVSFAIRDSAGDMLGSVGVDDLKAGTAHNGELGYWLGRAARGRSLAIAAVRAFIPYAFGTLGLERPTAHTLAFNAASVRVLERNGFVQEGRLRRYTRTVTGIHDTLVFGRLREDASAA